MEKEENFEIVGAKDHFYCRKCKKLLSYPVLCSDCDKKFCNDCKKEPNNCPFCNGTDFEPQEVLHNKIKQLKSRCLACKEEMSSEEKMEHPNLCLNWVIECNGTSKGCKEKLKRGKMKIHQIECHFSLSVEVVELQTKLLEQENPSKKQITQLNQLLEIEKQENEVTKTRNQLLGNKLSSTENGNEMKGKSKKRKIEFTNLKKNHSAFIFFCGERRSGLEENDFSLEVSKKMSSQWKELTEEEKRPYFIKAEEDKKRYLKEKEDYEKRFDQNDN